MTTSSASAQLTIYQRPAELLQNLIRFNTTNPPGDVTEAAEFLHDIFEREGISVTQYEGAPGKINLAARLLGSGDAKPILLLHHMDVVPADASRWEPVDRPVALRARKMTFIVWPKRPNPIKPTLNNQF